MNLTADIMRELNRTVIDMTFMQGFSMPSQRFFTPTNSFWQFIDDLSFTRIVDAGAGTGELVKEAIERGYDAIGNDVFRRDTQEHVEIISAFDFDYQEGDLVLICRPDHSGWADNLVKYLIEKHIPVAYVGLRENIEFDLDETLIDGATFNIDEEHAIGESGEIIVAWDLNFK